MIHLFESEPTIYNKYLLASLLIMKFVLYMCTCLLFVVTIIEIIIYMYPSLPEQNVGRLRITMRIN